MPVQAKRGDGGVAPTHFQSHQLEGVVCSSPPLRLLYLVPTVQAEWALGPYWTETTLLPSGFSPHTVHAVARHCTDHTIMTTLGVFQSVSKLLITRA
jgi:hypothetical protein